MIDWKIVDKHGDDVMSAESVRVFATMYRMTPRKMAQGEARAINSGGHDDAPVRAIRA